MLTFLRNQLLTQLPYPAGSYAGQTIVVTGSNTGIGKEAARHFARLGVKRLILAGRNIDKGHAAKADIEATTSCDKDVISFWHLDLSSYASVQAFAAKATRELDRIDIFIANAGLARPTYHTAEDNEETITVNVVSTILLTGLILPKMKETAERHQIRPTLTITSSGAHGLTTFPQRFAPEGRIFDTINDENADPKVFAQQYALSKLLEIFAVRSIVSMSPASAFPVTINCVNPGLCRSELSRDFSGLYFPIFKGLLGRSAEVGSRTLVHAASAGVETHGKYLSECKVVEPEKIVTDADGEKLQRRLWKELSEKLEKIEPDLVSNLRV